MVSNTFYCHPYLAKIPILTNFFLQMAGLKPPTSFTLNIKEDDEPPHILGLWDRFETFLLGKKRSFLSLCMAWKKCCPPSLVSFMYTIFAKDLTIPMGPGIVILPLIRVDVPIKRIHYWTRWWNFKFIVYFYPLGNDPIWHIFQMGWFNHQLVKLGWPHSWKGL